MHVMRSGVSCVSQDTALFHHTVRYNLCYGARGATEAQVAAACALAKVDALDAG